MKKTAITTLLCVFCNFTAISQNSDSFITSITQSSDSLTKEKRDSILLIAKEAIMKFGPDYYREYKPPVIERAIIFTDRRLLDGSANQKGRVFYRVTYLYDKTKEDLEKDFAVKICIWGDINSPFEIIFGSGFMMGISGGKEWRNNLSRHVIYEQKQVFPVYHDLTNSEINKKPKNFDELKARGYEEQNGQWVKVRPDTPPKY
jgi:hypothetical protein